MVVVRYEVGCMLVLVVAVEIAAIALLVLEEEVGWARACRGLVALFAGVAVALLC